MVKRLGIFFPFFRTWGGGVGIFLDELLSWLQEKKVYPVIVCLGNRDHIEVFPGYTVIMVGTHDFDHIWYHKVKRSKLQWFKYHTRRFFNPKLAKRIVTTFVEQGIKHVHIHNLSIATHALARYLHLKGITVTAFCHDFEWVSSSVVLATNKLHPLHQLGQRLGHSARPYIWQYMANSDFIRQCLVHEFGYDIPCDRFFPVMGFSLWKNQRSPSIVGKDKITCIYSGALAPYKGIMQFLDQIHMLGITWLHVHIYGDGPQRHLLEAHPFGQVYIHGHVHIHQMRDIFAEGDFTVVPSLWDEPFGRVVFESVASGCPVLASQRGGLIEQSKILPGVLTYDPNDLNSLLQQIIHMRDIINIHIDPTQAFKAMETKNSIVFERLLSIL